MNKNSTYMKKNQLSTISNMIEYRLKKEIYRKEIDSNEKEKILCKIKNNFLKNHVKSFLEENGLLKKLVKNVNAEKKYVVTENIETFNFILLRNFKKIDRIMSYMFVWRNSKEGFEFWEKNHFRLKNMLDEKMYQQITVIE